MRSVFILILLAGLSLSAPVHAGDRPVFVTTIPPLENLLARIVGERGEVVVLLPAGASPHTYEPRPSDLRAVESAIALFHVARELDGWAADLPVAHSIPLISFVPDSLLLYFSEDVGEEEEREQEHGSKAHRHAFGKDPHFWTDPLAVKAVLPGIVLKLGALDPGGIEEYERNALRLASALDTLHTRIQSMLQPVRGESALLSHPFNRYYMKRYGLDLAGIIEIIPGREPTARELSRIIRLVKRKNVRAIFTLLQLSRKPAEIMEESTKIPVYTLDPLGGVPGKETYEEIVLEMTKTVLEGLR